jgi:hypothetical protein
LLKTQNEFQSAVIHGLIKQAFLAFFVLSLSCAALLSAAQSAPESPANGTATVKHLLQRITVLEHGLEAESQAIAALNARLAQVESSYLAVKSSIEQNATLYARVAGGHYAGLSRNLAARGLTESSAAFVPEDSGKTAEHGAASFLFLSTDESLAAGGFLTILLLLLALRFYRKKQEQLARSISVSGFVETGRWVEQDETNKKHQQSLQKLAALKKAAQAAEAGNEPVQVARQDLPQQNELPGKPADSAIADARSLLQLGRPEMAVHRLESALAKNKNFKLGWQLLFKILHDQNMKTAFRKNALRFKRFEYEQFPEIWGRIQAWGHTLEPDEPLYMSAQEKKRRFFSNWDRSQ